jgi:predicted permease
VVSGQWQLIADGEVVMAFIRNLITGIQTLFRKKQVELEMDEELREYLDAAVRDKMRAGMSYEKALRAARVEMGSVDAVKEEIRSVGWESALEALWQDIRYGLRQLRRNPGFTIVAVLTLALGIGATTAIFSVLDGVVLRPLPYPHPEELVSVELAPLALDPTLRGMAPEDYFIFREQGSTFQEIGIYAETDTDRDVNVTGFAEPERVHALDATHGVLAVLGIRPLLGRIFHPSDDAPHAPPTAVLTYGYWQRKYSADPTAVGRTIIVDGVARQIIGVLPANFRFLDAQDLALILPLQLNRDKTQLGNFSYFGIARLKAGSTLAQANADVARMLPATMESFPPPPGFSVDFLKNARLTPSLQPLKQDVIGSVGKIIWVLMGGIGMVLLIACANVANLLLVRTEGRQHELALRAALGASRRRMALQLLRESLMIGLVGSTFGLGLAWAALRFLVVLAPAGLPRIGDIEVNSAVLLFTLGTGLFTSLCFGMLPVLKHGRGATGLPEGGRTIGLSRERHRARNFLVTLQVALALILLICSGLMIRTFRVLSRVNPGFVRPAELQTFRISITPSDVSDNAKVPRIEEQIQAKLAAIPGVSAAAFASDVPMDGNNRLDNVYAADHTYPEGALPPLRHLVFVSPGYFHTLGIPLITGRDLTWTDTYNKIPVALVSENLARENWGTPDRALGQRIRISTVDDWREIIGVVGDVHDVGMDKPARTTVYWPTLRANFRGYPQLVERNANFVVRSSLAGSESLMSRIRQAVWSVDSKLPLAGVHTMTYYHAGSMARASFTLVMLGIAGSMALLLSTVGLYGVIAYSVSRCTREIGIRMALGAQRTDVMSMVLGEGLRLILLGLATGLAGSLALTRFLSHLLFGVTATDPLTFAGVAVFLALVALAACYIPARHATTVDPMVALRYE